MFECKEPELWKKEKFIQDPQETPALFGGNITLRGFEKLLSFANEIITVYNSVRTV